MDTEADPAQTPAQLNASNTFNGNVRGRIVQEWFGAVEVLDPGSNPVTTLTSGTIGSTVCGTSYVLQNYNGGAETTAFALDNVGHWLLVMGDYVHNNGNYFNCDPHIISASSGALSGSALFSFDGNALTDPVSPDLLIPYSRPVQNVNGRYQVAQVTLQVAPPPPPPA